MEVIGHLVGLFHNISITVIIAIIGCSIAMSVFLFKILFDSDFFSNYDRNL